MQDALKKLLLDVQQGGGRSVQAFADAALRLAIDGGVVVLEGLGDDAKRVERTARDYLVLQARELLSGRHKLSEWLHIKSQWSSQQAIAAVIVHAQVLGFVANVFGAALEIFGGAGRFVSRAGLETVGNLLRRLI